MATEPVECKRHRKSKKERVIGASEHFETYLNDDVHHNSNGPDKSRNMI